MDDLLTSMRVSAAGMKAQGTRLRVVAENLANADTRATSPADTPYRRKIVSFKTAFDRETGADLVRTRRIGTDGSPFDKRYEPGHPAADAQGYVLVPNVDPLIELTDMREAQRSYEANLALIRSSKGMIKRTIEILR